VVLVPTVHKKVLFYWCPHLQAKNEVQVNPEPLSYNGYKKFWEELITYFPLTTY
jgi:hypothetical protein